MGNSVGAKCVNKKRYLQFSVLAHSTLGATKHKQSEKKKGKASQLYQS